MSELARYEPNSHEIAAPSGSLREWADEARAAAGIATSLCKTSFVPDAFRDRPEEATAAILTGRELGLSPMASLRAIYVIKGTPAMYANALRAVVQSHGHRIWVEESTDTRAIVCGRRRDAGETERVTWTMDRARKAGLIGNQQYQKNPAAMLVARATAECARRVAADAIHGVPYAVEELVDEETIQLEAAPAKKAGAKRTAKRATVGASRVESVESVETRPAVPEPDLGDGFHNSTPSTPTPQPDAGAEAPGPSPADGSSPESIAPASITAKQIRNLGRLCTANGLTSRLDALAYVARVIGHEVESRNELTIDEASQVIDALEDDLRAGKDSAPDDEVTEERYG